MSTQADWITLPSLADDVELNFWRTPAVGERKGGLVLIQEIFGITEDLKRVCADFAKAGYEVLAPSLFDRFEHRVQLDYATDDGMANAIKYATTNPLELAIGDMQAAIDYLRSKGPVFLTGFCYGGYLTWMGASRCEGLSAASSYYGRLILQHMDEQPNCPIIFHFGETDAHIPLDQVREFADKHPDLDVHIYAAGHGFVSNRTEDYDPDAEKTAMDRTLALFSANAS